MSGSADQARRLALVGLSRIVDPGHRGVYQAVQDHGAVEVWEALRRGVVCEPVSPELRAGASLRAEGYDPAADLDRLSRFGARLVCPGDAEWPAARLFWPQEPRLEPRRSRSTSTARTGSARSWSARWRSSEPAQLRPTARTSPETSPRRSATAASR